jgi:hypothetical protein
MFVHDILIIFKHYKYVCKPAAHNEVFCDFKLTI